MPQLVSPGLLMTPRHGGGGDNLPTIQPLSALYESDSSTVFTAASITADREKYAIDRFIKYCKHGGFWDRNALNDNAGIWLMCQGSESACLVNLLHPGTHDLTKVGTPTFTAFDGVSSSSTSNYYDSGIQLGDLTQDSCSIGGYCLTNNAGATNAYDMGAIDGSSNGTRIMAISTTSLRAGAVNSAAGTIGATTDWALPGMVGVNRNGSATEYGAFNYGVKRVAKSANSVDITSTATISFLFMKAGTTYSRQKWGLFFLLDGLSDAEYAVLHGAVKTLVDGFRYGLPNTQPAGYGDASPSFDAVYYGNSMSAFVRAYRAAEQGLSVAIVTDWLTESVEQYGGMPANGLGWVDISGTASPATSGLLREMGKQINIRDGHTDGNNQAGMSHPVQSWNIQVRRMMDSTRSSGSLPGRDISIFHSAGLRSVAKATNNAITSITTNDGRVLTARRYGEESYDGDLIYISGCPYTSGREAAGSDKEALNGYHISQRSKPGDDTTSNAYDIDPYVTEGDADSGLLPDIILPPSYTDGQAIPSLQGMNFRLQWVNGNATGFAPRCAPLTGGVTYAATDDYNASRYEVLGRYFDACAAADHDVARADLVTIGREVRSNIIDINNAAGVSTDYGQSGDNYLAAGASLTARQAVIKDLIDYTIGYIYWLGASGDDRIPSSIQTFFSTYYGLDATAFVDWVTWKPMYIPGLPYRREPIYMLNNAASSGFKLDANDVAATDSGTPRSVKTISAIKYPMDCHNAKWIAYDAGDGSGTVLWRQGGYGDDSSGGTDGKAPWPMEASMPVKADCPNLSSATCPAMTKVAYAAARMEQSMCQAAELLAIIDAVSIEDEVAVQDVDYDTVRTRAAALTDVSVLPDLPVTD
jgi:hypothetical protein